jgi:archaellum component FlaF (FlaF/FlaG flagellin family)
MSAICYRCEKDFKQRWRLDRHLKRKKLCKKIPIYQNIPEYTKTTKKHTKIYQNIPKPKQEESSSQSLPAIYDGFVCEYCDRNYKKRFTLNRHLKTCKIKKAQKEKEKQKEKQKDEEIKFLKRKVELYEKIHEAKEKANSITNNNTNTNCHNTNMTNSNNTVNITVNDYGQENVNYLKDSKYKRIINKILGNGMLGLQQYIKYKYCNPEAPENLTIKYTNQRSNKLKVREDNSWKTRDKNEVMNELYDRDNNIEEVLGVYEHLNDLQEVEEMDNNQEEFVTKIASFYDTDDEEEDGEMKKLKDLTLSEFYDCYKKNKEKYDINL